MKIGYGPATALADRRRTIRPRVSVLAVLGVALIAVACGDPREPATFTRPSPVPPLVVREVRLTGHVVDVDRFTPVDGATLTVTRLSGVPLAAPVTTMTGPDGAFELTVTEIEGLSVIVDIARDGYEARTYIFGSGGAAGAAIRMYPTLTLRPDESLDTSIAPLFASMGSDCRFLVDDEPWVQCRRLLVNAPPGQAVEVELTPHGSLEVGLALQQTFRQFERRITVTRGEVWIVGQAGPVTVRATRQ